MPREYFPTGLDIMGSSPTRRIASSHLLEGDLAFQPRKDFRFFQPRKLRQKPRRLDDDADVVRKIGIPSDLFAVYDHVPFRRLQKPADALEQNRFAGAVVADDAVDFTSLKRTRNAFEHGILSEGFW